MSIYEIWRVKQNIYNGLIAAHKSNEQITITITAANKVELAAKSQLIREANEYLYGVTDGSYDVHDMEFFDNIFSVNEWQQAKYRDWQSCKGLFYPMPYDAMQIEIDEDNE